ncbi:MAG: cyanoexosortase A [Spirulinaceae cyanobacterium]
MDMKSLLLSFAKPFKIPSFWLLALVVALTAIYLSLIWRIKDFSHLGMSLIFGTAVFSLLWEKRHNWQRETTIIPSVVGGILITLFLWRSATATDINFLPSFPQYLLPLRLLPLIGCLAIGLLASGFRGLKQYWQALIILFILGIKVLIYPLIDPSAIVAKFSSLLLMYLGFDVSIQGEKIILPAGGITVLQDCSGLESMLYLFGLAVIFLFMFPLANWTKRILVLMAAILLGFAINGVRVAFLAALVASRHQKAFTYWHIEGGSLIFGGLSILAFGLFCLLLLQHEELQGSNNNS